MLRNIWVGTAVVAFLWVSAQPASAATITIQTLQLRSPLPIRAMAPGS
jgi:hypothetical protein